MFISVLDLFKIGVGPSSSHTMGPMSAASAFRKKIRDLPNADTKATDAWKIRCLLKGSLAYTGIGHGTDRGVILGLHGYQPADLATRNIDELTAQLGAAKELTVNDRVLYFDPVRHISFDRGEPLAEHPNGMIFQLVKGGRVALSETYFSIGGGFIHTLAEMSADAVPLVLEPRPYPFASAKSMLEMADKNKLSIAAMKRQNELSTMSAEELDKSLDSVWQAMLSCIEAGIRHEGTLPGGLNIDRRAHSLHTLCCERDDSNINDWLCAYAIAVNEENAAGHMVVTAPTNGAAGVIPAVLCYAVKHRNINRLQIHDFLLTAAAIGGIIKHCSSISGAEVGCQGEVGSAAAMAAAGLCAILGGSPQQIENSAEIALEHHLGMTCDPVGGLVQIPCIERNGFGAIKAFASAQLAIRGSGKHAMPLDACIAAMKQTGLEMSNKYKETSQGGLAVNFTEC